MKDRLVTLVGALASLALVTALLFPQDPPPPSVSKPTSQDRGELGLHGLKRWLELNEVPTLSLRRRYSELDLYPGIPPSGNLLLSSLPHGYASDPLELEALRTWLDQGNRILVLAAINDRPDWALLDQGADDDALLEALGFAFRTCEPKDDPGCGSEEIAEAKVTSSAKTRLLSAIEDAHNALEEPLRKPLSLRPATDDPLPAGVNEVATRTSAGAGASEDHWRLEGTSGSRLARPVLLDAVTGEAGMWAVRTGNTMAWISSYPDLFGNRTLGEADNARFLHHLLGSALGPDGALIFDDLHHGLSDLYDPDAFFRDERLWNTLLFIAAFWLLYVLGYSNRLAPPVKPMREIHASGLVEAMAGLFARRLPAVAVGRRLLHHFFTEVRVRHKLAPTGNPCWEILAADPSVRAEDLRSLRRIAQRLEAGDRPDLHRLSDLLHSMRETLR